MLSLQETFDIVLMTLVTGYIFMDVFRARFAVSRFDARAFWLSCAVTGSSIVLHEMGHKFTAITAGIAATFHAHYGFLFVGVLLKVLHFPFLFIVPGYVSMAESGAPLVQAAIAFAGPFVHLVLWRGSAYMLSRRAPRSKTRFIFLVGLREINRLLFILNLLPIPPLDGFHVVRNLYAAFI